MICAKRLAHIRLFHWDRIPAAYKATNKAPYFCFYEALSFYTGS
jgi:hypothetical protein